MVAKKISGICYDATLGILDSISFTVLTRIISFTKNSCKL